MNLLYFGKYKKRFNDIIKLFNTKITSVNELCFGDIYVANFCKKNNIKWAGFDINEDFIDYATKKGYNAKCQDIMKLDNLPKADICIIAGSLYHFYDNVEQVFKLMLNSSGTIIISEPIKNFSSSTGILGKIARISANAGKGNETFRYNKKSFIELIKNMKNKFNFDYRIIYEKKDILIIIENDRN